MTNKQQSLILLYVLVIGLVVGAFVTAIVAVKATPSLAEATLSTCERVLIQDTENDPSATDGYGADATAILLSAGWRGDPTDHSDRLLYSPACVLPALP